MPVVIVWLCMTLGVVLVFYSGTLVTIGFGAVDSHWWFREGVQVCLSVNSTNTTAEFTDESIGFQATSFDTGGRRVNLMIMSLVNDTIISDVNVTGTDIADVAYMPDEHEIVFSSHSFIFRVSWAGENATLQFLYSSADWSHADGPIYHTNPGFEETRAAGFGLFAIGVLAFIGIVAKVMLTPSRSASNGQ